MAKQVEILFKGMTRPAMFFGVPILPLISVLALISLVSVWTNIMYILVAIPIVLIMRFIVTFDDFMYSILFQNFKLKTPSLNKKYYGVKTFSSMEYRKMSIDKEEALQKIIKEIDDLGYKKQINLKTSDVSRILGVSNSTIEKWRKEGIGIDYNQVGGRIFYSKHSMAEWLLRTRVKTA